MKSRRSKKEKRMSRIRRRRENTKSETDEELVLAINSVGRMLRESNNVLITKKMRKKIPHLK
jgi:hypothetical protein